MGAAAALDRAPGRGPRPAPLLSHPSQRARLPRESDRADRSVPPNRQKAPVPTPSSAPVWLPEPPLEPLRGFLENAGLPVPRSYLHDSGLGVDLLEDVGDRSLAGAWPASRDSLYREACALIPRLQALEGRAGGDPCLRSPLRCRADSNKSLEMASLGRPGAARTRGQPGRTRSRRSRIQPDREGPRGSPLVASPTATSRPRISISRRSSRAGRGWS